MTEPVITERRKGNAGLFRKSFKVKMPPESAKRQGEITTLAFQLLGSREAVLALLNEPHADLGARPLDLATESDEGFARVAHLVRGLAEPASAGK